MKLIATHLFIASTLKQRDIKAQPFAYDSSNFKPYSRKRNKPNPSFSSPTPHFTSTFLSAPQSTTTTSAEIFATTGTNTIAPNPQLTLCSQPLLLTSSSTVTYQQPSQSDSSDITHISSHFSHWLSIDDTIGSNLSWLHSSKLFSTIWRHAFIHTSSHLSTIFNLLHPSSITSIHQLDSISSYITSLPCVSVIDITYQPSPTYTLLSWMTSVASIIQSTITSHSSFCFGIIWLNSSYYPSSL